jgi:hypothetical protein
MRPKWLGLLGAGGEGGIQSSEMRETCMDTGV